MTLEPRGGGPVAVPSVRGPARGGGRTGSGEMLALVAGAGALAVVIAFVALDYGFNQQSHRLIKIAAGLAAGLVILLQPRIGLLLLPALAPFLVRLPTLPVPGLNALNALLLSVFGTWVISRTVARESWVRGTRLGWTLAAFLLLAAISVVRGIAFPTGYEYEAGRMGVLLFRTATTLAPYFIAVFMIREPRDRAWLMGAIIVGLLAEIVATIWFGQWRMGRALGTMGQPNVLGAYLAIGTVIAAALLIGQRNWALRLALVAAVVGGGYGVLLSVSRGALAALAVGLTYVALKGSRLLALLILVVLATSPLWAPEAVKERVLATIRPVEESDDTELEGSAQARLDTWSTILNLAAEHPIDGVGFGGLGYVLRLTGERLGLRHIKDSPHSTFMRVLGEMGVIGLALYLLLLWKCWALARDGLRLARDRFEHQVSVALGAATLVVAVNCWFGDRFFEFDIMCGFWILAAVVDDVVHRARMARA